MKIIKPSYEIETPFKGFEVLKHIEKAGRTCYKSEDKITEDSAIKFAERIMKSGHESVIEHFSFSVRFICDRGVTHELVRHRLASYSQESTRYVRYGNITVIMPNWIGAVLKGEWAEVSKSHSQNFVNLKGSKTSLSVSDDVYTWLRAMKDSEDHYTKLLDLGWKPQQARSVLPNSLKTEIVTTANLREWRHILRLRTGKPAHPQIREVMIPLLKELQSRIPVLFDDINPGE